MDDSKERVLRPLGCLACLLDVLDPRTLLLRSRSCAAHPPTCDNQADLVRCGHPNHAQTEHQATTFDAGDGTAPARAYERSLVSANVDADDALENSAATSMPWFPTRCIRTSCFEARGVRPGRTTAHRNPDAASSVRVVVDVPVVEALIATPALPPLGRWKSARSPCSSRAYTTRSPSPGWTKASSSGTTRTRRPTESMSRSVSST
jgi:hypothetical protein